MPGIAVTCDAELVLASSCGKRVARAADFFLGACLMLAVQPENRKVITLEGLALDNELSPLRSSFRKHHALQCGFCTPGMLTTAHSFLTDEPEADRERNRDVLSGNLCRRTGYVSIVEAVYEARSAYGKGEGGKG
jgi:aerobic-type carbon monoxide dehydrogenase small subunit (CoxS/CutS family)